MGLLVLVKMDSLGQQRKRKKNVMYKKLSKLSLSWEFREGRTFPTGEVGKASGNTQADWMVIVKESGK